MSSPPAGSLTLHDAWEALAGGLHIQRLALHLEEWRDVVNSPLSPGGLFTEATPAILAVRPERVADPQARAEIGGAGLSAWVDLPDRYGAGDGVAGPLAAVGRDIAGLLLDGVTDAPSRGAVIAVCAASAWWVGVFATIRHLGVHHLTLEPVADEIGLDVLRTATRTVVLGTATRVLQHRLRTASVDDTVRLAYCRAVTEGIVRENAMPSLLDALGELRLVDLVATSVPWRGRFTKYAGGTGAGQVE
ncbi:hypothetical protein [Candidatus Protofrankia californiensis]|uniref:hypothetical protein n=1 Tax=Candidatus Protofrankia californiensis TaxID=1839754 RepID=UPI0019D12846|nr:hypothetical protein [Candidatus Protofrankia californiensis]